MPNPCVSHRCQFSVAASRDMVRRYQTAPEGALSTGKMTCSSLPLSALRRPPLSSRHSAPARPTSMGSRFRRPTSATQPWVPQQVRLLPRRSTEMSPRAPSVARLWVRLPVTPAWLPADTVSVARRATRQPDIRRPRPVRGRPFFIALPFWLGKTACSTRS